MLKLGRQTKLEEKSRLMYVSCDEHDFYAEGTIKRELAEILRMHMKKTHKKNLGVSEAERTVKIC